MSYKIVQYCRGCKTRFVLNKGDPKRYYCEDCQKRFNEAREKENEEKD